MILICNQFTTGIPVFDKRDWMQMILICNQFTTYRS